MFNIFNLRTYPTKNQILAKEIKFRKKTIQAVQNWKKEIWIPIRKSSDESLKFSALEMLVQMLAEIYEKPIKIAYEPNASSCHYDTLTKKLIINKSLSIVSTLHEFGHHLFGASELKTCRWSVHLFRKVFKKAYQNLSWQHHMLVRR